jgi:hypothetical protein
MDHKLLHAVRIVKTAGVDMTLLCASFVTLILSNVRLLVLGSDIWLITFPILMGMGSHLPHHHDSAHSGWSSSLIPWDHAFMSGISNASGNIYLVARSSFGWAIDW